MKNEDRGFLARLFLGMTVAGALVAFTENRDEVSEKLEQVKKKTHFLVSPVVDAFAPENLHRLVPR